MKPITIVRVFRYRLKGLRVIYASTHEEITITLR